jgi:hypothetical protein
VEVAAPFAGGLNRSQWAGLLVRALIVGGGSFRVTLDKLSRPVVTLEATGAAVTIDLVADISHQAFLLALHDPKDLAALQLE